MINIQYGKISQDNFNIYETYKIPLNKKKNFPQILKLEPMQLRVYGPPVLWILLAFKVSVLLFVFVYFFRLILEFYLSRKGFFCIFTKQYDKVIAYDLFLRVFFFIFLFYAPL